jgi:general secretion pathway protein F
MKFRWVATDDNGDRHTGVSEAESEREMVARLRSQSLLPQSIKQQRHRTTLWRFSARVSHAELTLFTRQLATLMAAALPLDEALAAIQQQKRVKILSVLSEHFVRQCWKGNPFPPRCNCILDCLIPSIARLLRPEKP